MEKSIIVIDGFYNEPERIRNEALSMDFNITGNYPGNRTVPLPEGDVREFLERIIGTKIDEMSWNIGEYTGTYQFVPEGSNTWVHADRHTDWSCIVYLHPNPKENSGTSFYKHKETGSVEWDDVFAGEVVENDGDDWDKWIRTDTVSNRFNRAVLFRGKMWHAADEYFGTTKEDARLFQTFFFNEVK